MKKNKVVKKILIILAVILIIIVSTLLYRIIKGYIVLGSDHCEGHFGLSAVGPAFTTWKCEICGYSDTESDTGVPKICETCAIITGRCERCGKLKSANQK